MLRWILAPLALAVAAMPAAADSQGKKENAAAVAAIKARAEQLRANPQDRGCLGADAVTCLASLSFGLTVTTDPVWLSGGFKLPKPAERDIDGRPISQLTEFLVAFDPKDRDLFGDNMLRAQIVLRDGEHVSEVKFFLKKSPLLARTEAEWGATHVFDLATAVLGPACIGTDRLGFYRRYDALQKQTVMPEDVGGTISDPSVSSAMFGRATICGARMTTGSSTGVSASVGSFGGSSVAFETISPADYPGSENPSLPSR